MDTEYGSRAVATDFYCNINLIFGYNDVYSFNSTVNPYVMEYCDMIGQEKQGVSTDYAASCLCSGKVLISPLNDSNVVHANYSDKFEYEGRYENYLLFENPDFIPIGFCYDYCISEDDLLRLNVEDRSAFMLKAMVVEDKSAAAGYLTALSPDEISPLSDEEFTAECEKRAACSAYSFKTDSNSCTAEITVSEPELVFFSIAFDEDFTAYVDGKETDIINANIGFMAVPVPEGTHTVELVYNSRARDAGTVSTIAGTVLLALYCIAFRLSKPSAEKQS